MKCPYCQSINPDDSLFCTSCGQKLPTATATPSVNYCTVCGAPLEPGTNFCIKCGTPVSAISDLPEDDLYDEPEKKKRSLSSTAKFSCIIAAFLVIDILIFFLILKDEIHMRKTIAAEENAINEQINLYADQISSAENDLQNKDFASASANLAEALSGYADIYEKTGHSDIVDSHIIDAYASYLEAVQKQVSELEEQPPSPDTYQKIESILAKSLSLVTVLTDKDFLIDSSALVQLQDNLPSFYKEKYIFLFNDLRTNDDWSYDDAWQYMTDGASVLQWDSLDDPFGSRYAYTLAGITHREVSSALDSGSLSYSDAASQILSVLESTDYNPILMVDLAVYLDYAGDSQRASTIKNACLEVYHYLAYTENIYIDPNDLLVSGKTSTNASSTISLKDFYYFNDFGQYSVSDSNGLSPEGRQYIRNVFQNAVL